MPESSPLHAVIDIGSNAVRLRVGALGHGGRLDIIEAIRAPVRLGQDAFGRGRLGEDTIARALETFRDFRHLLERKHVPLTQVRAIATSAMREAENRQALIEQVKAETGIVIEVISGTEEARLISLAVRHALPELEKRNAFHIDIGGGSVEFVVLERGQVTALESLKMGTVRLLSRFGGEDQKRFVRLLDEFFDANAGKIRELVDGTPIDIAVGTGGNIEALGQLGRQLLDTGSPKRLKYGQLKALCKRLDALSYEERLEQLKLRPDRADVIIPASHVLRQVLKLVGKPDLLIPGVGLAEGALLDLLQRRRGNAHQDALAWAASVARKYRVDREHADQVRHLALQLFDQLTPVHGLPARDRLLLELAALLHEIGIFVRPDGHHRHAHYLLSAMPMLGISDAEQRLLALVVRCQRKKLPDGDDPLLAPLDKKARERWLKLVALLRLAIAFDKERCGGVAEIHCHFDGKRIEIRCLGKGDLLLERWAALRQKDIAEKALGHPIDIEL
ncbi:Ppx/GppA phosphatase family protein [Methylomarinovum tepidoasis]|uniref:Ppx/GppA phosphatase family protein n=1 Tax=Methylomarinovum tepidoasis TaxID=2840183 RepID=UPI00257270B6|nr:Ppx/GppA phosphatase family protein [Methylomarinovum sp. IN45]